jgi:Arc/MetJ-type ribon-helix-helix transcriptional regulator
VEKAVNSNMDHAVDRAVERGIFESAAEAREAYKQLSVDISDR